MDGAIPFHPVSRPRRDVREAMFHTPFPRCDPKPHRIPMQRRACPSRRCPFQGRLALDIFCTNPTLYFPKGGHLMLQRVPGRSHGETGPRRPLPLSC